MPVNRARYQLHIITLRLWQEIVNGELWEWRGEVKNTSSGEVRYFRDFSVLADLLPMLLAERDDEDSEQFGFGESIYTHQERTTAITTEALTMDALEAGVHATNRAFEAAIARGDAGGAAAVYTTGGQALPPNGATVSAHAALQNFWQRVMDMGVKKVTLETVELERCGDIAYEVGRATFYGEDSKVLDIAKFIVIWQQEDGQWKWRRDIWNSNNPA